MRAKSSRGRLTIVFFGLIVCLTLNYAIAADKKPAAPAAPAKPTAADCQGCHDGTIDKSSAKDREDMVAPVPAGWQAGERKADPKLAGVALKVDVEKMKKSAHGADCAGCHADLAGLPHPAKLPPVRCGGCHSEAAEPYAASAHGLAAKNGGRFAPTCADCHGAHEVLASNNPVSRTNRENMSQMCGACHVAGRVERPRGGGGAYDEWRRSIHGQKLDGKHFNATCGDCHDSHAVKYAGGQTAKTNVAAMCGKCHKPERKDFEAGIHGAALARGNLSSPTCTDCHGAHAIQSAQNPASQVYGFRSVENVCGECHKAERINERFGIRMTTASYASSYHGLALAKGDVRAAGCASCHGAHAILPSSDPRSSINPARLADTCGKCHPGIGRNVTLGKVHPVLSEHAGTTGEKVQFWVRWAYLGLIPAVLGFMFFHNFIDWLKKIRAHLRRMRAMGVYERLSRVERIQHIVLLVSFTTLVISGFALVFGWKLPWISGEWNETIRAYAHRTAALAMIGWAVFHFGWAALNRRGRGYVLGMVPTLKDAYDMVYMIAYNLGMWREKPKFDRFTYVEKMEYLAMVWGTAVMVLTGFMLWLPRLFLQFLPLWAIDVANIVHYMEAILATLAIIIWHFYSVLINPDIAPMATHWITGTLTEEEMEHEHEVEWERVKAARRRAAPSPVEDFHKALADLEEEMATRKQTLLTTLPEPETPSDATPDEPGD